MVEIGSRPVLWHIMKIYAGYGYSNFLVALGHKGERIKRWSLDYRALSSSLTNTDIVMNHNLWTGVFPALTVDMLSFMIDTIRELVESRANGRPVPQAQPNNTEGAGA